MQNLNNDFQQLFAIVVKLIIREGQRNPKAHLWVVIVDQINSAWETKELWRLPKEIWWNNVRETRNTNELKTKLNELNLNVLISLQTQCLRLFVDEAFIVIEYHLQNIVA